MQLNFKFLTLKNFISVGAVTQAVDLSVNGLTLILGHDIDEEGVVTRNGAGKSTMLQGICYALYGEGIATTPRIKVDNLVNDVNGKNMLVSLDFEIGEKRYRIERGRKPGVLKFFVNDAELKKTGGDDAKGTTADLQEDIDTIVGMDHTMFCHLVALNTLTVPFLKSPAAAQREIMEKLMGVTQMSERAKILTKKISTTKDEIKLLEAKVIATLESNKRIEMSIATSKQKVVDWDRKHDASVREIETAISSLSSIDVDAELAKLVDIETYDTNRREIEAAIALKTRELELLERERQTVVREAEALARDLDRLKVEANRDDPQGIMPRLREHREGIEFKIKSHDRLVTSLDQRLAANALAIENANGSTCSACGQDLDGTDHLDRILTNLQNERTKIETEIATAKVTGDDLIAKLAEASQALDDMKITLETEKAARLAAYEAKVAQASLTPSRDTSEINAALIVLSDELTDLSNGLKAIGARPVSRYRTQKELYAIKQDREALATEATRLALEVNPHTDQIDMFSAAIVVIDPLPLEEAQNLLKHQDYLLKLLTKPDSFIRQKIVSQNLHNLNQRLQHYCEAFKFKFRVEINSEMSVDICTMQGRDRDFSQMSRGEGNRLVLAMSLAFRDLWESLNHSMNLLFVDELLDSGMDQTGAEAALQVLKSLGRDRAKNVFLISHKEELRGRIDRTLLVSKEDGFSRFDFDQF
jgi:DNA repair exonuclease SbcCD ATPase subunit